MNLISKIHEKQQQASHAKSYMLFGILFGAFFPIFSTVMAIFFPVSDSPHSFFGTQASNPLLWIIDTAPLILGYLFFLVGKRQDNLTVKTSELNRMNIQLQEEIIEKNKLEEYEKRRTHEARLHQRVLLKLAQMDRMNMENDNYIILENDAHALSIERVSFWMFQGDGHSLKCCEIYDSKRSSNQEIGKILYKKDYPRYFAALTTNQIIVANDAQTDRSTSEFTQGYLIPNEITSIMDLPVWFHGKVVGIVCHENIGKMRDWTTEEIDFGTSIATMISLSLEFEHRKEYLKSMQASEEKYRIVVENANEGIFVAQDGYIRFANKKALDLTGYTASEISKKPFLEIVHPEDRSMVLERYLERLKGSSNIGLYSFRILCKNGDVHWIEINAVFLLWEDRPATLNFLSNITERRNSEIALRESEERFRVIPEALPIPILISRKSDGVILYCNSQFGELIGAEKETMIGKRTPDFYYDIAERKKVLDLIAKDGVVKNFELRAKKLDGTPRWALLTLQSFTFGKEEALFSALQDITERKQADEEIRKTYNKMRELTELRTNFITTISHEFRTPLTNINSSAQILERYRQRLSDEEQALHLQNIQKSIDRMTELLNDVLIIGKAADHKIEFQPKLLNIKDFCNNILDSVSSEYKKQHVIVNNFDLDIEEAVVDEKILSQCLRNLFSNAMKYSPIGSTINFSVVRNENALVFSVQDNGIGISDEDQKQIYEPFHRGGNVGNISGTGLGMAIVKQLIELHGGSIACKSKIGEGSLFTFNIPSTFNFQSQQL